MPTSAATRPATAALSPVSSTGMMPIALSSAIASALVGFTLVGQPDHAPLDFLGVRTVPTHRDAGSSVGVAGT